VGPSTSTQTRWKPADSAISSVPSPPSATGQRSTSTSCPRRRRRPLSRAVATSRAEREPLNLSGAISIRSGVTTGSVPQLAPAAALTSGDAVAIPGGRRHRSFGIKIFGLLNGRWCLYPVGPFSSSLQPGGAGTRNPPAAGWATRRRPVWPPCLPRRPSAAVGRPPSPSAVCGTRGRAAPRS
jgi:hypothetical protein